MKKLKKNQKQNETQRKNKVHKKQFKSAQSMLEAIEMRKRNGTPLPKDNQRRRTCQDIVNKCEQSKKSKKSKEDNEFKHVLALVDDTGGIIKPVDEAHWPCIKCKICDVMGTLEFAKKHIIFFRPAGLYQGFFLIWYKNRYTLSGLVRCMRKARNIIEGMRLSLIPATQIPKILENQSHLEPNGEMSVPKASTDLRHTPSSQDFKLSVEPIPDDTIKAEYIRDKSFLEQMENSKTLTETQRTNIKRAKERITNYERINGTSRSEQEQQLCDNKFVNISRNCSDDERFKSNHYRPEIPSTSRPNVGLGNDRVPEIQNFNRNDNSRSNSERERRYFECGMIAERFDERRIDQRRESFSRRRNSELDFSATPERNFESGIIAERFDERRIDQRRENFESGMIAERFDERRIDQRRECFSRMKRKSGLDSSATTESSFRPSSTPYSSTEQHQELANSGSKSCKTESTSSRRGPLNYREISEINKNIKLSNNEDSVEKSSKAGLEKCVNSSKMENECNDPISQLKRKVEILRKQNTEQPSNDVIIILSDDSDGENTKSGDKVKAKCVKEKTSEMKKIEKIYCVAVDYLEKMKHCKMKDLPIEEQLRIQKYRFTVRKYRKMLRRNGPRRTIDVSSSKEQPTTTTSSNINPFSGKPLPYLNTSNDAPPSTNEQFPQQKKWFNTSLYKWP